MARFSQKRPRQFYSGAIVDESMTPKPFRVPLYDFPDVVLHADEMAVKRHPQYSAAKTGDADAAKVLFVAHLASRGCVPNVVALLRGQSVRLCRCMPWNWEGVNEIPAALADLLSEWLGLPITDSVVQSNTVGHTGASGFQRLANQAFFAGEVESGHRYLLVDDFIGQGGTLANLIGYIESRGGHAVAATALTGKPYSAKLAPDDALIEALRYKHGQDLEDWWRERFGFGFDCLTRSEARYLENSPDAQAVRNRLIAAGLEGSSDLAEGSQGPIGPADGG